MLPPLFNGSYTRRTISQLCTTNPSVSSSSTVLLVFNGCLRSLVDHQWFSTTPLLLHGITLGDWLGGVSQYLVDQWFHAERYVQFVLVLLCTLPYVTSVYDDQFTRESAARFAYYAIQLLCLLVRLALSACFALYLPLVIRQESPCLCSQRVQFFDRNKITGELQLVFSSADSYPLPLSATTAAPGFSGGSNGGDTWTMPSFQITVSTVLLCHIMERWSLVIGLTSWACILPWCAVWSGYYSLGQTLSACALGLLLHLYMTRTPLLMRLVDFCVHSIAALVTLFLVKNFYKNVSLEQPFAVYVQSLLWFLFALVCLTSLFTWPFLRMILVRRTLYTLRALDIQFMNYMDLVPDRNDLQDSVKFQEHSFDQEHDSLLRTDIAAPMTSTSADFVFTRFYNKRKMVHMLVALLVVTIILVQLAKRFSDDFMLFFQN